MERLSFLAKEKPGYLKARSKDTRAALHDREIFRDPLKIRAVSASDNRTVNGNLGQYVCVGVLLGGQMSTRWLQDPVNKIIISRCFQ